MDDLPAEEETVTLPCALGPERMREWRLVLADSDEHRRLEEAGYYFD
jgi:hypothetical protein